jgi:hypothetical protein
MSTNASSEPVSAMALAYRSMSAQKAYSEVLASGLEQARMAYDQAQQSYNQEVQSLYAELLERTQQAYRAYGGSLNGVFTSAPSYEDCTNAYRQYVERLQELFTGGDAVRLHKEAYEKYLGRIASQPGRHQRSRRVVPSRSRGDLETEKRPAIARNGATSVLGAAATAQRGSEQSTGTGMARPDASLG